MLRGADVWYATCTDIARYLESYDKTDLTGHDDGNYRLTYTGGWDRMLLTVCAPVRHLKNISTGQLLHGVFRNGVWVFNNVMEGVYQQLL
jgi:hypothetical protein